MLNKLLDVSKIQRLDLTPTQITNSSISSIDFSCFIMYPTRIIENVMHVGLSDHTGQYCPV